MPKRDTLWKGIIEDLAEDLLRFFFPEFVDEIDFSRGFVFLDKELQGLLPDAKTSSRYADKLIKVWLTSGRAHWFLLHIEVQGYRDKNFAERMFQSFYRIRDKFKRPVTALVVYTHGDRKSQPGEYCYEIMGTTLLYRFNVFTLADYLPQEASCNNFFALLMEAAKAGIGKKMDDATLSAQKLELVRKMLRLDPGGKKVRKVLNFIRYYVRFAKRKESLIFEQRLDNLIQNRKNMGIEEAILTEARQEGMKKGLKKGIEKGIEKGREEGKKEGILLQKRQIILNGVQQGLSVALLATLTELSEAEVAEVLDAQNNEP